MIKFEDLKVCLKQKIATAYVLDGVDEYLISSAYKMILKSANIEVLDLNLIKFGEGVVDCNDIVRACETMPVFSNKKIVYLDLRLAKKSEIKNVKQLNDYLTNPNPTTILIISVGANDDDFGIDKKCVEWMNTDMQKYLRPETLFGTKFESYLNQQVKERKITTNDLTIDISDF